MLCPHCFKPLPPGIRQTKRWRHTFSPVLASAVRKFAIGVGRKGRNEIHLRRDLTGDIRLTVDELNNFTKVRFFALVAHVRRPDGTRKQGYWLLTRRGSRFLKGQEAIPRWVATQSNHVESHAEERIMIRDLSGLPPIDLAFEIVNGETFVPCERQRALAL